MQPSRFARQSSGIAAGWLSSTSWLKAWSSGWVVDQNGRTSQADTATQTLRIRLRTHIFFDVGVGERGSAPIIRRRRA